MCKYIMYSWKDVEWTFKNYTEPQTKPHLFFSLAWVCSENGLTVTTGNLHIKYEFNGVRFCCLFGLFSTYVVNGSFNDWIPHSKEFNLSRIENVDIFKQ